MKKEIVLFILLIYSVFSFSQSDYRVERTVNVKIRTNSDLVLDETNARAVLFFTDNTQSLNKSQGVHFTPLENNLKLIAAFGILIDPANWQYRPEASNENMYVSSSTCDFFYFLPDNPKQIVLKTQILFIRRKNGSQSYLVIAYDGENTLVVTTD